MQRRTFLQQTSFASAAFFAPQFLKAQLPLKLETSRSGKILVIIQLSGGNDGLNTIVPYRNDLYYKNRPTLSIKKNEVLKPTTELGFHPQMTAFQELYDQGYVSVLNSVGYPNPDRSHLRSMDIWHTASNSDTHWNTGWLGRYLDYNSKNCESPHYALGMNESLALALKGEKRKGFVTDDIQQHRCGANNEFHKLLTQQQHEYTDYFFGTMIEAKESAAYLSQEAKVFKSKTTYPYNAFGKDLKQVAELITAESDTRIYYLSLGGFDTHSDQKDSHAHLLKHYADGVKAFVDDLKQNGLLDEVLILTFSEFGRRIKQNASGGTDHGTANNLFLIGSNLKKAGFYNAPTDLANLDKGDLKHEIDFRQIYATVLDNWLDTNHVKVLNGSFNKLGVL